MAEDTIVMFPDLDGCGLEGAFGTKLRQLQGNHQGMILVPVLNGSVPERLKIIAKKARILKFDPIISNTKGLTRALLIGYEHVTYKYPEAAVVRLDVKEHRTEYLDRLVEAAEKRQGMVVGDLKFTEEQLRPGSLDEFAHLCLWPELYGWYTKNSLRLSCAHGYQAFAAGICAKIFPEAKKIIREAERIGQRPVDWGLDGAMILAAHFLKISVGILDIPAQEERNRDGVKIIRQFSDALRICQAAAHLFDGK